MSFSDVLDALNYDFMVNALVGGALISLCAGLLGVCLVLKRFSMIGDGLSHVGFGAVAIGAAAGIAPLKIAIPVVIIAAVLLLHIGQNSRIGGDSAIAVISTGALAVGIMAASVNGGTNIDLNNYMFGSILTMKREDIFICLAMTAAVVLMYLFMHNKIFAITFDESFAGATGIKTGLYSSLIAVLTAVTIVIGMQMMGALLMSSFVVFPALISMRLCRSFRSTILVSAVSAVLSFAVGLFISFSIDTPAGATVVTVNLVLYILAILWDKAGR